METNNNLRLLSEAPIPKALLKLGIPTMIGMMVSSLYNLVDAYFVGTLGTSQQAAVAAVYPVSLVMLGIGLLFGTGAGSYLSRLLGNGKWKQADECASTALAAAVVTAVVLVVLMLMGINPLLRMLGCTPTMLPYAREYAVPFIIGLVINVFNSAMSNLATAEGATFYSMRSMLFGGVANIILDPIFITVLHMGVFGAALATLIARLISLSTYLFYILRKKSSLHFSMANIRLDKKLFLEIAKIGVPAMIYQILCSTALSVTNNLAAGYGDSAIAALGIVSRISSLGIMTIMGFLKGYQTFAGFNYGAQNYRRMQSATRTVLIWTTAFAAISCLGMILFRVPLIRAFNKNDAEVLAIGAKALVVNAVTFLTVGFQVVYSTKFMGLGKAKEGGLISLGRQGFFFLPIVYLFTCLLGLNGLIMAQPAADLLSMALVCVLAGKNSREEKALITAAAA